MSLSGNLGFVSLDEVLRLLTRSKQRGTVDVRGEKVRGRIFVNKGGIGLATTFNDDNLQRHLLKSGLLAETDLREDRIASVAEGDGGALISLLREMTVESVYQLGLQGESFEVFESEYSPLASPKTFDLEDLLTDSRQRLNDWAEVSQVISDLDRAIRFRRDLGDRDEVKIDKDAWKVLSEVGVGRSVRALAEELGTTDFWAARVTARLIQEDLLETDQTTQELEIPAETWEEPQEAPLEAPQEVRQEAVVESMERVDPNQSWWTEPEHESGSDTPETEHEEAPDESWVTQQPAAETEPVVAEAKEDVEEDTEAFLEKVFSDLDSNEESDEGYGLLRRRRMGTLRDLSNESG